MQLMGSRRVRYNLATEQLLNQIMHLSCSKHSSGFPKKLIFILLTMAQASQVALMVKNPPANAGDSGDAGSIPGLGRSSGGGHGNRFQYSCLENLLDRGALRATVHRVTKSQTQLKQLSTDTGSQSSFSSLYSFPQPTNLQHK